MKETTRYWILAFILIIAVMFAGFVKAQPIQCQPAEVNWQKDGVSVRSFGCVMVKGDTLYIMPHFVEGVAKSVVMVMKVDVVSVTLYVPAKVFKASKS